MFAISLKKIKTLCRIIGIPDFLDSGRKSWTLDAGFCMLNSGRCTLDANRIRTQFLILLD